MDGEYMKEYREVLQFYYKGNCYNMYLDKHNKHFFLKNDGEGNLSYTTIEEFIELTMHFTTIPNIMRIEKTNKSHNKLKLIPKVLIRGSAVTLSFIVLTTAVSAYQTNKRLDEFEARNYSSTQNYEQTIESYASYDTEEEQDELVVDTYLESDWLKYLYIYDMEYLDKALDYSNVSISQVKDVINKNDKITPIFKNLMYEYCDGLAKNYPGIELRVLYENLKTLEVVECDREELTLKTLSIDTSGCYLRDENKIYVLKGHEYKKGTWDYQVIFHEMSHCMRTAQWNKNDVKIQVQAEGQNFSNITTGEALNSLFAVSLFDYEEKDIAYQLQSNYHKIMIDCLDNYSLSDYINHSESYYASKLDEYNKDDNYATTILELIEMQYDDFHSDAITVEQDQYYPIYDYIADMYYSKYLNSSMSYSQATKITDDLVDKITFDVPEEYNIDVDHFYDHLNDYCNEIGISVSTRTM